MPPLLSIVTPSLNQGRHLPRCLESVAAEAAALGEGVVEHIVMDGGSDDGSREIIERHAEAHPGLVTHWSSRPDAGQSAAINEGFRLAAGAFGAWLNADDRYKPGGLAPLVERLMQPGPLDVLVGRCRMIDEAGATVWAPRPPDPVTPVSLLRLKSNWFNGVMICQPECAFRLSAFRDAGGLDEADHYAMDHALWVRLALRGARFEFIDHPVAVMLVHAGQKSADNRSVVRAMLRTATRVLSEEPNLLGAELEGVRCEIDSMRHKLACAEALSARWRVWRASRSGHRAPHPDAPADAPADVPESLPDSARYELDRLTAPHAERLLRRALRSIDRAPVRCAVVGAPGPALAWLDRARGRFRRRGVEQVREECHLAILAHPASVCDLESAWQRLEPGGVLAAFAAPAPARELDAYLRALETLLDRHLSTNDDLILGPEADAYVERILAEHTAKRERAGDDDRAAALWLASHPEIDGIDLALETARLGAEPIESLRYGSTWFHPLAPFPFVPFDGVAQIDMWQAGLWRKKR